MEYLNRKLMAIKEHFSLLPWFFGLFFGLKTKEKDCTYKGDALINPCMYANYECNECKYWK